MRVEAKAKQSRKRSGAKRKRRGVAFNAGAFSSQYWSVHMITRGQVCPSAISWTAEFSMVWLEHVSLTCELLQSRCLCLQLFVGAAAANPTTEERRGTPASPEPPCSWGSSWISNGRMEKLSFSASKEAQQTSLPARRLHLYRQLISQLLQDFHATGGMKEMLSSGGSGRQRGQPLWKGPQISKRGMFSSGTCWQRMSGEVELVGSNQARRPTWWSDVKIAIRMLLASFPSSWLIQHRCSLWMN